jgi:hypothetical protein
VHLKNRIGIGMFPWDFFRDIPVGNLGIKPLEPAYWSSSDQDSEDEHLERASRTLNDYRLKKRGY